MRDESDGARGLLPLVFAATLVSIMGNSLLSPAIPDVLVDFGRPDQDGGLLIAATSLPGIVVAPVIGLLADRFGRRPVLVPCLAVFGAGGLAAVLAPTFALVLAGRFVMGFGAAGLVNLAITLIGDAYTGEQRTRWIGRNAGVLTAGLAVFPLVSGLVTDLAGWRWALAPYSLGLVVALAAWRVLPPGTRRRDISTRDQLTGMAATLRHPTIRATFLAAALGFAAMFGVFLAVLPTHLEREFGLSAGWRGVVIALPAVTSSLAAFNLARIRRRIGVRALLVGTPLVWAVAFATIGFAGSVWVVGLGALAYGAGEGSMFPTMQDLAIGATPDAQRATVMATWTGFARFGQTVGPLLAAAALSLSTSTVAMLVGSVLAVAMSTALAGGTGGAAGSAPGSRIAPDRAAG